MDNNFTWGEILYAANASYRLRFAVNVPAHTYSVYASAAGGAEQAVAVNHSFRTEQADVFTVFTF